MQYNKQFILFLLRKMWRHGYEDGRFNFENPPNDVAIENYVDKWKTEYKGNVY